MSPRAALISYNNALRSAVLILDIKVSNLIDFGVVSRAAATHNWLHGRGKSLVQNLVTFLTNSCLSSWTNLLSLTYRSEDNAANNILCSSEEAIFHYYLAFRFASKTAIILPSFHCETMRATIKVRRDRIGIYRYLSSFS